MRNAADMYAHHVPHTYLGGFCDKRKIPQPFDLPRFAGSTPDWIRTSDLQSRSLTLYPTELRARSPIILAQKYRKIKGAGLFFLLSSLTE